MPGRRSQEDARGHPMKFTDDRRREQEDFGYFVEKKPKAKPSRNPDLKPRRHKSKQVDRRGEARPRPSRNPDLKPRRDKSKQPVTANAETSRPKQDPNSNRSAVYNELLQEFKDEAERKKTLNYARKTPKAIHVAKRPRREP